MLNTTKSLSARILLGFSAILSFTGCQIDNLTPNGVFQREKKITIEATYEMPEMETKTVRDNNAKIYWTPGDAISLFFGSGTDGGSKFVAQNDAVALKTAFSGSITAVTGGSDIDDEDTYFWGLYPYDETASCDGSSVTMRIPAVQPGMEGTFAPGMAPSLGRSQKLVLSFRNIWSGFGFTVSEPGFQSVTFRGNGGEFIAGKARIGIDEDNLPKVLEILDGVQSVTLTAPEGGFVPGQYYYMQFFPCTFNQGFIVELVSDTKRGEFFYADPMEYPRSTWKRAANVDDRVIAWIERRTVSVDGGMVELTFFPDEECEVEIPPEAQHWISYVSTTVDSNRKIITLNIHENAGAQRSSLVFVHSNTRGLFQFIIEQAAANTEQLALEREALVAIYNAMGGSEWLRQENWCTDRPVGDWQGVRTDADGFIVELLLSNLSGSFPDELTNLKHLQHLAVDMKNNSVTNLEAVCSLTSLEFLGMGLDEQDSITDYSELLTIPPEIGNLTNLKRLDVAGIKGPLPEELFTLENLTVLELFYTCLNGPFPSGLSNLHKLEHFYILGGCCDEQYQISGPIPDDLYDCTSLKSLVICYTGINGEISPKIQNLSNLGQLDLHGNKLTGTLPVEMTQLHLIQNKQQYMADGSLALYDSIIWLFDNELSGKVPAEFQNWPEWNVCWRWITENNNLDISDSSPHVPEFDITTLDGGSYSSDDVYDNELTIFYQWATWCPFSPTVIPVLKDFYSRYHEQGLEIVSWSNEGEDEMRTFVEDNEMPWICFRNGVLGDNSLGLGMWPYDAVPTILIFDNNGEMVYYSEGYSPDIIPFVYNWFGDDVTSNYESTDFSADGTVVTLQTATDCDGIDLVLMGDAFSDRQIADGTYDSVMRDAMEAFFSEEPYKSFRDRFNVSYVNVVSLNEGYDKTGQALETSFGEGTRVYGNDEKVISYAQYVVSRMDDVVIIVMMNKDAYAGTCYMYSPEAPTDYSQGLSIAYFPTSSDTDTFNGLVSHEAGGHGFAKLADEYAYESMGAISQETIDETHTPEEWGWYKNVDFTNNPAQVKWSPFISDNRYANEGIGCYEGGFTYWTGVWRPTENSIMRYNTGGFNAPSRYAIWYRINKLLYRDEWEGTYEDFVTYDAVNRTSAATAQPGRNYVLKQLPPLDPPVVVGHSWRDAK